MIVVCAYQPCSLSFSIKPSKIRPQGNFCSPACFEATRKSLAYTCIQCGTAFTRVLSYKGTAEFCSRRCRAQHRHAHYPALEERLWPFVQHCNHDAWCIYCCWPWQGTQNIDGYGLIFLPGKKTLIASRLTWEIWNAQLLPKSRDAAHYCNNPPCCNPVHIYSATRKQNVADSMRAGTHIGVKKHLEALARKSLL